MKPKYNRFRRNLPAAIFLAASLPFAAQAAVISSNPLDGSLVVTIADNGANTLDLNGGVNPVVTIAGDVQLTGDGARSEVVSINAGDYTITNAGELAGDFGINGINGNGFSNTTINNSGTVSGYGTSAFGILDGGNNFTVDNSGDITGTSSDYNSDSGYYFASASASATATGIEAGDNVTITNSGNITATASASASASASAYAVESSSAAVASAIATATGIEAGDNVTITNSGNITATASTSASASASASADGFESDSAANASATATGIEAGDNVTVNNSGDITGDASASGSGYSSNTSARGTGIDAGNNVTVNNSGDITGTASASGYNNTSGTGIDAGNDLTVINSGNITGTGTGSSYYNNSTGINAGNSLNVVNSGTISGTDYGIYAGDSLTLTNLAGGSITSSNYYAVYADDNAYIENYGDIYSQFSAGIDLDDNGYIYNGVDGTIIADGSSGAIYADSSLEVHNYGTISGNYGIEADDYFNLTNYEGASITGSGDYGIEAEDFATIVNSGSIFSSSDSAIYVDEFATITNNATGTIISDSESGIYAHDGFLTLRNSGTISGSEYGVVQDSDFLDLINYEGGIISSTGLSSGYSGVYAGDFANIVNHGEISSVAGYGISVEDDATITNTGTITGSTDPGYYGIYADDNLTLDNSGTISGYYGVYTLNGATISNSGTISGDYYGIFMNSGNGLDTTINNTGTIEATGLTAASAYAIFGGAFNQTVNLGFGSVVTGIIDLGGGVDEVNFLDGQVAFGGPTNVVFGDIYGVQSLTKNGFGTSFVGDFVDNGYDIQADTIMVTAGSLYLNGFVTGSNVATTEITVDGGELGGTGFWDANVAIADGGISASFTPQEFAAAEIEAIGTLNIIGNVTHDILGDTYTRVNIRPQAGPIVAGVSNGVIMNVGTFDVGSMNIRITPTNTSQVLSDGTYTVIDSNNTLLGLATWDRDIALQFSQNGPVITNSVLTNYFTTVGTADSNSNVILTIDHDYAGLAGLSANQAAFGQVLDNSINSTDADIQQFIATLDYSDLATVQAALDTLDPSASLAGLANTVLNSGYRISSIVRNHLMGVRNSASTTTVRMGVGTDSQPMMNTSSSSVSNAGLGNVWGALSYDSLEYDGNNGLNDFDGDTASFTAGIDFQINPMLVLGFLLDGSTTDIDGNGFGSDVEGYRGAVYGTWGADMGLYSDFLVGYGTHNLDSDRNVFLGNASSDVDADSLQAMWTGGYTMGNETVKHGPFAGFEYQNVDVDGFTETSLFPVNVDGFDVDSFRALIGYRVDTNFGRFRPYASVAYAHEFEDDASSTTATVATVPFRITGAEQGSAILITAGTGIALTDDLTLDVGYRGDIATDDGITSHGGTIGLNYSF